MNWVAFCVVGLIVVCAVLAICLTGCDTPAPPQKLQIYAETYRERGVSGDWRWRVKHVNGNVMADSAEGYKNRSDMLRALHKLHPALEVREAKP